MKEFDIEKLKRENVFKTPDGFFEEVQNKVVQEITPVSRGRIIKLNWAYAAAASVAILGGITFFFNSDSVLESQPITQIAPVQEPATNELADVETYKEEAIALQVLEQDLTSVVQEHQKTNLENKPISNKVNTSVATQKEKKSTHTPEIQVDQILASFTSAELATIGKNTEQDIYLDLYN